MTGIRVRLPQSLTSNAYRYQALSTKERLRKDDLTALLHRSLCALRLMRSKGMDDAKLVVYLEVLLAEYFQLVFAPCLPPTVRRVHVARTIDSFSERQCWSRFRTRKRDLPRLFTGLGFAQVGAVRLANKGSYTAEEIFLFSMNRLVYPGRYDDLCDIFGRDYSAWSRAFTWFIEYMMTTWGHLVSGNLRYWAPHFPSFSEAIRQKIIEKGGEHYQSIRCCAFVDCTVIQTSRPDAGNAQPGPNAPRYNRFIQQAAFNGWKKFHGYKYQTLEAPNGLALDLWGPMTFRHSDTELYTESNLNERMRQIGVYCVYGDGIYAVQSNTMSASDPIMTKARISNEWDYGVTANLFAFCKYKRSLKMTQRNHSDYYTVSTLLRNFHLCLYDGLTASYYNLAAPELEEYLGV
jgi:hypothetical protein